MPATAALGARSFAAVQLLTIAGAVAATTLSIAGAAGRDTGAVGLLWRVAVVATAIAGGALASRSYRAVRRELVVRIEAAESARAEALTDELTGIYNRRGFRTLAEHQLRVARRNGSDVLVLYADVNGFKATNDLFGHAAGDRALQQVAALLRRTVRETDIVARLGGDEFAVLVVDAGNDAERAVRARLDRAIAAHNASGGGDRLPLSLSVGSAHLDADRAAELDDLLRAADESLYRRKVASRGSGMPRAMRRNDTAA